MCTVLRLCLGLSLLIPSLAHAAVLGIPSNGDKLSGIGVISGWKCEANGPLTVRFNEDDPVPLVYGSERPDTRERCGDANNGFVAIWNWSKLGDGIHTAVAYDNGVAFARSTFEVATTGEEFLTGSEARLRVPNFPSPGEEAWFEWNQSTQHLELRSSAQMNILDICAALGNTPPFSVPLLRPPPLPCQRGDDFDGEYFIQFQSAPFADTPCQAPRGTMQVRIREGKISGSTRAPPLGRVRIAGEVCNTAGEGLFVGEWGIDRDFKGIFSGSLSSDNCDKRWQDIVRCTGVLNIFPLPRQ